MNTNGYFKWAMLITTLFMVIISGSFTYTLITNSRIDKLEERVLEVLEGQYRMSADIEYIRGVVDRDTKGRGTDAYSHFNRYRPDAHTFVLDNYLFTLGQNSTKVQ